MPAETKEVPKDIQTDFYSRSNQPPCRGPLCGKVDLSHCTLRGFDDPFLVVHNMVLLIQFCLIEWFINQRVFCLFGSCVLESLYLFLGTWFLDFNRSHAPSPRNPQPVVERPVRVSEGAVLAEERDVADAAR